MPQVRATRLRNAARVLPGVIAELTTAAWRTQSTELWQALASTYRTAHDVSVKLGYYDLSSVALDRMDWAAQRASDPQLAAVRQYMRALVYFREGEYRIGQRLIASGHGLLGQAEPGRATTAVIGQLHLGATVIAARAGDTDAVEATSLKRPAAPRRPVTHPRSTGYRSGRPTSPCTACPPRSRCGTTTTRSSRPRASAPAGLATSRRAHFLIDRARSEMEIGRTEAALGTSSTHATPHPSRPATTPGPGKPSVDSCTRPAAPPTPSTTWPPGSACRRGFTAILKTLTEM